MSTCAPRLSGLKLSTGKSVRDFAAQAMAIIVLHQCMDHEWAPEGGQEAWARTTAEAMVNQGLVVVRVQTKPWWVTTKTNTLRGFAPCSVLMKVNSR